MTNAINQTNIFFYPSPQLFQNQAVLVCKADRTCTTDAADQEWTHNSSLWRPHLMHSKSSIDSSPHFQNKKTIFCCFAGLGVGFVVMVWTRLPGRYPNVFRGNLKWWQLAQVDKPHHLGCREIENTTAYVRKCTNKLVETLLNDFFW